MKFTKPFSALLAVLAGAGCASAANSFAGSNLYYAAGLSSSDSDTLFSGMKSAGMKVLRAWLDGESTATSKGKTITSYPSLEPNEIGTMHSWNALSGGDVYDKTYGMGYFYQWENATSQFDNRLVHVLNHEHTTLGKPWKELSDHIIGFEAENEAMIGNGESYIDEWAGWQCDRATTIRGQLGDDSGILVFTGGQSWMEESVQSAYLQCDDIDVVSIHAYGTGDFETSAIETYVQEAQSAGKLLIFEEWGACYYDTSNNDCPTGTPLSSDQRNSNIQTWASQITAAGMPWLYWQVLPNADPHYSTDYEIGIVGDPSWSTLQTAALAALNATAAFDFSAYLL